MPIRSLLTACSGVLLFTASPALVADVRYPGPPPGRFNVTVTDSSIRVTNRAIAAEWTWSPTGLKWASVADAQSNRRVAPTGEVFHVVLADGTRYLASDLRIAGRPQVNRLPRDSRAPRLAARSGGRAVELTLEPPDRRLQFRWRVLARAHGNYIREELDLVPTKEDVAVREIAWFHAPLPEAESVGRVDGSPVVAGNFFVGFEDPMATTRAETSAGNPPHVIARLQRNATLRRGDTLTQSFVIGVAPHDQMRRAFLYYLERERAHPYRPFLHYNSWYDIAWTPFALNETNCLDAIRLFGERFILPHNVVMDSMVFDDGWDDPQTLWTFHAGFPNGFTPLAALARKYNTRIGVWLSPFGGYGEPRDQRIRYGREQGYEINATGFSLAGPKYYAAFKNACVGMIRNYAVNHFKFDGIASGMYADGSGADYILDTEAMRRLMLELRAEEPDLYINLTTGSWPSPFWLRYADSIWRQGGDMGHAGKGVKQQQWLTYRDQEVFRNIVGKGPLFPLNSLMTQGVAYSRQGYAGDPEFNSAGFKDDVRAFFGSGTGLQELYIQPERLTAADWKVLAEAARWARAHADVLVDTHWIKGDPSRSEPYGYASWNPEKVAVMLRNPDDQPRDFTFEARSAFQLPMGAPTSYRLHSPWEEDASRPPIVAQADKPVTIPLKPFEVLVLQGSPE